MRDEARNHARTQGILSEPLEIFGCVLFLPPPRTHRPAEYAQDAHNCRPRCEMSNLVRRQPRLDISSPNQQHNAVFLTIRIPSYSIGRRSSCRKSPVRTISVVRVCRILWTMVTNSVSQRLSRRSAFQRRRVARLLAQHQEA